jgi:hypothetical protein
MYQLNTFLNTYVFTNFESLKTLEIYSINCCAFEKKLGITVVG